MLSAIGPVPVRRPAAGSAVLDVKDVSLMRSSPTPYHRGSFGAGLPAGRVRSSACWVLVTLMLVAGAAVAFSDRAVADTVGAGSYASTLPSGATGPADVTGAPVTPQVIGEAAGSPVPTNTWWSSLVWQRYPDQPYGQNLFAHPLSLHARSDGMGVGAPSTANVNSEYHYGHHELLTLGVAGLNSPGVKVSDYSDWTVTARLSGGGSTLEATFGHGIPFVYAQKSGGDALVTFNGAPDVWYQQAGTVGVSIAGRHFGVFAPGDATWSRSGDQLRSGLAGSSNFTVALLPSPDVTVLQDYAQYAFSVITDTRVDWNYDVGAGRVTTEFTIETEQVAPDASAGTLLALFRHQWLNTSDVNTSYVYSPTARGDMRVVRGDGFTTSLAFQGVLPSLPEPTGSAGYSRDQLYAYVDAVHEDPDMPPVATDTYWTGKALNRLGQLVRIADQVGHAAARDHFLTLLRTRLEEWLTAETGETQALFAYDDTWGTLIGFPASYGSETELNDHHFHYGYFVLAAAIVAQYDPGWADDSRWGAMVEMLIRDANSPRRDDPLFPFLRAFDPYAGHSWASGHAGFGAGNNEESSSESMMFNYAVLLWGTVTGDEELRDLGAYLYTTERSAIQQYWYDTDNAVYPAGFDHAGVGIVWGDGAAHATWFSPEPEMIHGINMLPITGGSLYLGRDAGFVQDVYDEIVAENGGPPDQWVDILWSYLALADPDAALAAFGSGNYTPESGETKAHTYHWLHGLNALGQVAVNVSANIPTAVAFEAEDGSRNYVAYNPDRTTRTVTFSDGATCTVPPREMVTCSGDGNGNDDPPDEGGGSGATDPYATIQAEDYDGQSGTRTVSTTSARGGEYVGYVADGDYLVFDNVDFGSTPPTQVRARVASGAAGGVSGLVQFRVDGVNGPLLGSFALDSTGGWESWHTVPANVGGVTGVHDLYVVFVSGQPADFVNLDQFTFAK